MNTKPTITFAGGVGTVTGANFLLEHKGFKVLIDCGVVQGTRDQDLLNYNDFPYNPADIDVLIVTHAHLDHIGRIGKLVRDGFHGVIYSTEPTMQIARASLEDAVDLVAAQADYLGRDPLYEAFDIHTAFSLWKTVTYHHATDLADEMSFKLYDAGHILGSAQVMMSVGDKRVLFTGDLGNSPSPLLKDTEIPEEAPDYIVSESVYGDRNHEHRDTRIDEFRRVCLEVIQRKGVLVIPAFSVERTQELLYILNNMVEDGELPKSSVYVDSPLAIKVTKIYGHSIGYLSEEVQKDAATDNIFSFPGLLFTTTSDESKKINEAPTPKIIIAGSGMSVGGRVIHHEKRYLPDQNATILLVGYQTPGTLGRKIQEKHKEVYIFGEKVPVHAEVRTISGFSGHKDSDHLQEYLGTIAQSAKAVFCAMGETGSALYLAQKLRDLKGINAVVPDLGETIVLE